MTSRNETSGISDNAPVGVCVCVAVIAVAMFATFVLIQPATFHGRLEISPTKMVVAMPGSQMYPAGNVTFEMWQPSYLEINATIPSYWMLALKSSG